RRVVRRAADARRPGADRERNDLRALGHARVAVVSVASRRVDRGGRERRRPRVHLARPAKRNAERRTPNPGTPNPGTPNPGTPNPGTPNPGTPHSEPRTPPHIRP